MPITTLQSHEAMWRSKSASGELGAGGAVSSWSGRSGIRRNEYRMMEGAPANVAIRDCRYEPTDPLRRSIADLANHPPSNQRMPRQEPLGDEVALFRTRRFWGWFVGLWLPCSVALAARVSTGADSFLLLIGALISAGATVATVQAILLEKTESNRETYTKRRQPVRYWASQVMMLLVHVVLVAFIAIGI
jgi:hypothetical protein